MSVLTTWIQQQFNHKKQKHGFVLALGGGGSRGLAHLGVLEALEKHNLRPDAIVGTSIGALFGALYAMHGNVAEVRQRVEHFLTSDSFSQLSLPALAEVTLEDDTWMSRLGGAARHTMLYTKAATDIALIDSSVLQEIIGEFCHEACFEDTVIPLHITGVSFPHGECHLFHKGALTPAVAASMAIPGVFSPVQVDGHRYVDGGVAAELPALEARDIANDEQLVVAVNVSAHPEPEHEPEHIISMLDWTTMVKSYHLRQFKYPYADVIITPLVGKTQWQDFSHPEEEIAKGFAATEEKIPQILEQLSQR
ncbi:MAG: patatin-like phospholipase family protein [Ghiorsea sp.]